MLWKIPVSPNIHPRIRFRPLVLPSRAELGLQPDCINKVLLEHSHTHLFRYVHGYSDSSCHRDHTAPRPEIFTLSSFRDKVCEPLFSTKATWYEKTAFNDLH